jgi:hypothetical protein
MQTDAPIEIKYECKLCNKLYSSKRTLYNHNKKFHEIKKTKDEFFKCKFCEKNYEKYKSKWKHERTCTIRFQQLQQIPEQIKNELAKIKKESQKQKRQILRLQKKLESTKRLDNKTFKAVNKILMDRSFRNNSNNNNVNSNNNINNYQLISIGHEEIIKVLTPEQKKQILDSRLSSIEKLVEIAHCGEYNQFKNIVITNLKDNFAYKYDDTKGYFVTVAKNTLLEEIIMNRSIDIEAIYDELSDANKIDKKTKKIIQDFLDKMEENEKPFFDDTNTKFENFRSYKSHKVKILLYNNHDKITKDIQLLISENTEKEDSQKNNIIMQIEDNEQEADEDIEEEAEEESEEEAYDDESNAESDDPHQEETDEE